ncbi:hypothetical protein [Paenibacillus sp. NEAU-GSW1]|uniref:DUF6916 family protein n=1 Tax=Paenibacillus sp. NEAU-GSW1 TaxID=2682486 RepID=UPI0012E2CEE4|nr:hypothetical protein [Paenibacillus sp. NEAU-GSW1]MUT67224.1 hypothetical protein [Paenibacillus sp. NEAU-GSW1]
MTEVQAYKNAVNGKFQVLGVEPLLELELVNVEDRGVSGGYESFTLVFRGPQTPFIPQQTIVLRHADLEDEAMLVVPIGQDASGYKYEAVFNRLAQL